MTNFVEKLRAVGEETRLRLLRVLLEAREPLCICELVDIVRRPQYTGSRAVHPCPGGDQRSGSRVRVRAGKATPGGLLLALVRIANATAVGWPGRPSTPDVTVEIPPVG